MHNFLTCFDSFYFTPIYKGIDFSFIIACHLSIKIESQLQNEDSCFFLENCCGDPMSISHGQNCLMTDDNRQAC